MGDTSRVSTAGVPVVRGLAGSEAIPVSSLDFAGMHARSSLGATCVSVVEGGTAQRMHLTGSSSCVPGAVPQRRVNIAAASRACGRAACAEGSCLAGPSGVAGAAVAGQGSRRSTASAGIELPGTPAAKTAATPEAWVRSAGHAAGVGSAQQLRMDRDARRRICQAERAAEEAGAAEAVRLFRAAWGW